MTQLELRRQVAERTRAEERLRDSEARLQRVLEGSTDGFWDWNVATDDVQYSPSFAAMLGYRLDELPPRISTMQSLVHPADRDFVLGALDRHFKGESVQYATEHRMRRRDGTWLWLLARGKVVERDANGRPLRMAGTHTDISTRKRAERELDRFFDLSIDLLCIAGMDGIFRRLNPAFETVLGYSIEELIARPFMDFVHPDDRERTKAEMSRLQRGFSTVRFENRYVCRDGSIRYFAWTASPVPEEGLVYAAARDITEKVTVEEALRRSDARTRSIIDNSLGGIITTGAHGVIESMNPAAVRMFGYDAHELMGRNIVTLLEDEGSDEADLLESALGKVSELRGRRRNGETFACELALFEFHDGGGHERHFAAHLLDVSERQEVERMKKDFVSTVSHELRTPLTSIRGSLGLLASGVMGDLSDEARQMVAVAERNSVRLITLINDILDFEKLESGKLELEFRATPLMRVLERSVETVSAAAVQEGVTIEIVPTDVVVIGDELRLVQVVVNLLSNAVKYSHRGGVVRVVAASDGDAVQVRVVDAGRGIPPDARTKLFQRFQQIDSSDARTKPGTGLGLAICKSIVEQHGGSIGVDSTEGEGSTFWFRVADAAGHPERDVLLIESDPRLADRLVTHLAPLGTRVRNARSGWSALAAVAENTPAVIVLDVDIPDLDGFGVVAELRGHRAHRNIPLLVYTSFDLTTAERSRLRLGPTRFLTKSRSSDDAIRAAVAELLEQSGAREIA
ncbi:MAG: PAS domain S-box protein [Acidobacteriota bacterium]|nr:PAS domain S-box protein [Acidobacteriota bacterium]